MALLGARRRCVIRLLLLRIAKAVADAVEGRRGGGVAVVPRERRRVWLRLLFVHVIVRGAAAKCKGVRLLRALAVIMAVASRGPSRAVAVAAASSAATVAVASSSGRAPAAHIRRSLLLLLGAVVVPVGGGGSTFTAAAVRLSGAITSFDGGAALVGRLSPPRAQPLVLRVLLRVWRGQRVRVHQLLLLLCASIVAAVVSVQIVIGVVVVRVAAAGRCRGEVILNKRGAAVVAARWDIIAAAAASICVRGVEMPLLHIAVDAAEAVFPLTMAFPIPSGSGEHIICRGAPKTAAYLNISVECRGAHAISIAALVRAVGRAAASAVTAVVIVPRGRLRRGHCRHLVVMGLAMLIKGMLLISAMLMAHSAVVLLRRAKRALLAVVLPATTILPLPLLLMRATNL